MNAASTMTLAQCTCHDREVHEMKVYRFASIPKAVLTGFIALLLILMFEAMKQLIFGNLTLWQSHTLTIAVVSLLLFVTHAAIGHSEQISAEELRASLAFSDELVENLPAVVCVFDAEDRPRRWHADFLGYGSTEIMKSGFEIANAPECRAAMRYSNQRIDSTGVKDELEIVMIAKNGTRIPCYMTSVRGRNRVSVPPKLSAADRVPQPSCPDYHLA
jgi:hypothetical protein